MRGLWLLVVVELAVAAPFVTTWKTTTPNEAIILPITTQSSVNVNWGDTATQTIPAASTVNLTHTYTSAGSYNVSINGQILWTGVGKTTNVTKTKLVDIVSWGDGFLVNANSQLLIGLFSHYVNLTMSAPGNTQPVFLPGATLNNLFLNTSFNSALDWDLINVTSLASMFSYTPLNKPINFRNTRGVTDISAMFYFARQFNQPFHFDASGVLDAASLFSGASSFNQVVNLTNSSQMTRTNHIFAGAVSFNQPITFSTNSATTMASMFNGASSFNQPLNFNTSQVTTMTAMFFNATSFNQPINFNTPKLTSTGSMFTYAASFNQPVVMNTSNVTAMNSMFANASSFTSTVNFTSTANVIGMFEMFLGVDGFTQDLSKWNTTNVIACRSFCSWCGLPSFPNCSNACPGVKYTNPVTGLSTCSSGTRAPSAPSTSAPSRVPVAPSSAAPSSSATSVAPSVAPSSAAGPSPPAGVSVAAVCGPSLFVLPIGLFLLGF